MNISARSTICSVCHKPLTDPLSVAMGIGPVCRGGHSSGRRSARSSGNENEICKTDDFSDVFQNDTPFRTALVMKREGREDDADRDHRVITNVPHLVVHHSPNGFEFGYAGSGPADLALNVCQLYLNIVGYEGTTEKCYDGMCWSVAWILHQDFKRDFIAGIRHDGDEIPFERIDAWFKARMTKDLLERYSKQMIDKIGE